MREPLSVGSVRDMCSLLQAEVTDLLKRVCRGCDSPVVPPDGEVLREVWQEVGDDLRSAMREYPLNKAHG